MEEIKTTNDLFGDVNFGRKEGASVDLFGTIVTRLEDCLRDMTVLCERMDAFDTLAEGEKKSNMVYTGEYLQLYGFLNELQWWRKKTAYLVRDVNEVFEKAYNALNPLPEDKAAGE